MQRHIVIETCGPEVAKGVGSDNGQKEGLIESYCFLKRKGICVHQKARARMFVAALLIQSKPERTPMSISNRIE